MICDQVKWADSYASCHPRFAKAFAFMKKCTPETANGKYEIDGDAVYATVSDSPLKPFAAAKPEAHRKYADVQFPLAGEETIGVAALPPDAEKLPFDETKDIAFYEQATSPLTLHPGQFAIFFPQDAHAPCCTLADGKSVKKVVIKVKL
ncbi:MAG: YhcH/YjgK/YiaL family protein [Kiritimatiellae bacterium]|nr:YhcH/YjgK/YiaL family protein [Kiritimatiellia bacterium]